MIEDNVTRQANWLKFNISKTENEQEGTDSSHLKFRCFVAILSFRNV